VDIWKRKEVRKVAKETGEPKRFSDMKFDLPLGVANLKVVDILDQAIEITGVEPVTTSFGEAVRFRFILNGKELEALTHSKVIAKQLAAIEAELPVIAVLKKTGRSYTLS
jgi:hypothetical protein